MDAAIPTSQAGGDARTPVYAWFVLAVLCLATIVSYIDRQIINLLVEQIKPDLGINDTQIGLLQGFSFVLFYAILAVPLARLSDSGNRVRMITLGILCWSLATALCGLAGSFAMLFFARMFVGVGEATLTPSTYSLVPDYFTPDRASLAISIFVGASFAGSGIAYIIGGKLVTVLNGVGAVTVPLVGELVPWQMTFICAAIPGIFLLLLMVWVKEPARRNPVSRPSQDVNDARFSAVISHLRGNARLFTGVFVGLALFGAGSFAINSWTPAFLTRVYGWSPGEVGSVFGTMVLIASAGGVFTGGAIAAALARRGFATANLKVAMAGPVIAIPLMIAFPLMPTAELSLLLLAPALFFSAFPFGCGSACLPLLSPNRIRAQVVAMYMLIANLVGFTLGPTSIGLLTDYVYGRPELIGWSLATSPAFFYVVGALLIGWAMRPYRELVRNQDAEET